MSKAELYRIPEPSRNTKIEKGGVFQFFRDHAFEVSNLHYLRAFSIFQIPSLDRAVLISFSLFRFQSLSNKVLVPLKRMATGSFSEGTSSSRDTSECSESTVQVNVKTLDSQIYAFRVTKHMPVSSFKEMISSAVGLPVGQQRLIFRGKVLKDDHILSKYHLEDGDTLHLVVRQQVQSQTLHGTSTEESNGNYDNQGNESTPGAPRNRIGQVSHGMVLGTFNIGDQGEGIVPDLTRVIGAVLNSVGMGNLNTSGGTSTLSSTSVTHSSTEASQGIVRDGVHNNPGSRSQAGNQGQPGQAFLNLPFQAMHQLQLPLQRAAAVPSQQMVIPDSLTTLSEFINRMELALSPSDNPTPSSPATVMEPGQEFLSSSIQGLPTPQVLATVMRQAQQLLSGSARAALSSFAERLDRERATTDTLIRSQIEAEAMQVGVGMQHLGALLLELGRTIMTLRMGQSPAGSVVNAGPAVYISPSGPNPIMVQPSFSTTLPFGISSAVLSQVNPGIPGLVGQGDVSRHINIHIHSGTSAASGMLSVGTRADAGETTNVGHPQNQTQATTNGTGSADSVGSTPTPGASEGNQHLESMTANESGMTSGATSSALPHILEVDCISGSDEYQSQLAGSQFTSNEDVGVRSSTSRAPSARLVGDSTNSSTVEALSNKSEVQSSEKNKNAYASDSTPNSSRAEDASEGGRTVPLGLGSGGLQPKTQRRNKQVKSQVKGGEVSSTLPVDQNQNQQSVARGLHVLQSHFSGGSNINQTDANRPSLELPPLFRPVMDSIPLGGQSANAQMDVASMMSQVLQSPAMDSLLEGVSEQAGVGSPAGLKSILEHLTQSPSVRNTLNQIAQEFEGRNQDSGNVLSGVGREQDGIDFSRMFQQLIPVVSQALSQGSILPDSSRGLEPEPQLSNGNMARKSDQVDRGNSQTIPHQALERLEDHCRPSNVFRVVVENACHLYEGNADLIEEICNDDKLASEFMEMLQRDVLHHQSESRSSTDK